MVADWPSTIRLSSSCQVTAFTPVSAGAIGCSAMICSAGSVDVPERWTAPTSTVLSLPLPTIRAIRAPSAATRSPFTVAPAASPSTVTGTRVLPPGSTAITCEPAAGSLSVTHRVPVTSQLGLESAPLTRLCSAGCAGAVAACRVLT